MSMNSHVVGIRIPSEEYLKKVAAWKACVAADIPIPAKLMDYFDGFGPDEFGMNLQLDEHSCCSKYSDSMKDGFTIDLDLLPDDIRYIRFYNAY